MLELQLAIITTTKAMTISLLGAPVGVRVGEIWIINNAIIKQSWSVEDRDPVLFSKILPLVNSLGCTFSP